MEIFLTFGLFKRVNLRPCDCGAEEKMFSVAMNGIAEIDNVTAHKSLKQESSNSGLAPGYRPS